MPWVTPFLRSGAWSSSCCCRDAASSAPDLTAKKTMTKKSKSSPAAKTNGQTPRTSRALSDTARLKEFDKLGPFEIKDFVQKVASKTALENSLSYLNAGRGNPNWVATEPREAFFLLGQFAVTESKRV